MTTDTLTRDATWTNELQKALALADANVLRMVLYHLTGDESLAEMELDVKLERGGAYRTAVLAQAYQDDIRQRVFDLLKDGPIATPPVPSAETQRHMMEMFSNERMSDTEAAYCAEELALEEFPRDAAWTKRPSDDVLSKYHVVIIGAGFSGITAALQFKRLGIPFTIYERQSGVGGTWWLNDYPEARVDVSSFIYQYKFVKNYKWPEFYSTGAENIKYIDHVIDMFDLRKHINLNVELISADWNEETAKWEVGLKSRLDGSETKAEGNILISGSGLFATPNVIDFPGIENFQGRVFHTTSWDYSYDVKGKKVALIGTGSSGTQLAAWAASQASKFTIYQRTPSWFSGISIYRDPVPGEMQWLFDNVPYYWNWFCYAGSHAMLRMQKFQTIDPEWQAKGGQISELNDEFRKVLVGYIEEKLEGRPDLLEKCLPTYAPQGRRMVVDNGWFDTLKRDNTELVTETIDHVENDAIVTVDGVRRPVDLIILGSGFKVSQFLWPVRYTGRNGITLEQAWAKDGARAYMGVAMPGFPNMFIMYGPNGQPRTGSFHSWAEIWSRYAASAVVDMIERGARSVECRQEVFDKYNENLDAEYENLVWQTQGQGSYHVNEFGRPAVSVPWDVDILHSWLARANPEDYKFD